MNNHVHLLVTPADLTGPARLMQQVGCAYVRYFNERHGRTGTLWEGRFHSTLIDSDQYFLACCRYIEMNPVRASLAHHPGEYLWSSFRHNANGQRDLLVTAHPLYLSLGGSATERRDAYRGLFSGVEDPDVLQTIRGATRMGVILGSADFEEMVARRLERSVRVLSYGGDRKSAAFRRAHGSSEVCVTRFE
jgi:putative transposase